MILHIFPYQKFTYDYITKINELFGRDGHIYWVYGELDSDKILEVHEKNIIFSNRYECKRDECIDLLKRICKAEKVIIHSLFFDIDYLILLCAILPLYGKKYFWNIWGADLYNEYRNRNANFKIKIKEILRKYFIRNLRAVGYIPSDYEFLKRHYRTKAAFYLASYFYRFFETPERTSEDILNIMLGNSATEECRYQYSIKKLSYYEDMNFRAYCILSYPESGKNYRERIIRYGKKMLGDRFFPVTEYMAYDEYLEFLGNIDVAIFNHDRQQGLGNIAGLLYLGKKVFINPKNGCKDYFERMGAELYSTDDINEEVLSTPVINPKENRRIIENFYSDEKFAERWNRIFTSDAFGRGAKR